MPQNLRGRRPRRFGHNLLIRVGLRAYTLTLSLLGFKCTHYDIKSNDMNEKEKDFISSNKSYMPSAGLHGPLHMAMVCALCPAPCSYPSARSACTHTVALPAATWVKGWRGACTQLYSSYALWMIDFSLSLILDMPIKHELNGLNCVVHLQKVPH